jgi:formyl-CoA transferase
MLDEVVQDPQMRAAEAFVELESPGRKAIETINSPVFIGAARKRAPALAPEVGQHTREVLRELGYDDRAIDALIARGVAASAAR